MAAPVRSELGFVHKPASRAARACQRRLSQKNKKISDIVGARIFTTPELSHFLARTFCTHTPLLLLGYPNTKKRAYTLSYRLFGLSVFFL
jgi:hypothetical protein